MGRGEDKPVRVTPPPENCTCPPDTGFGNGQKSHIVGNPHCFIARNYADRESNMRRIPIVENGDHSKSLGYLLISNIVSDAQLVDTYLSWYVNKATGQVLSVSLLPNFSVAKHEQLIADNKKLFKEEVERGLFDRPKE